MVVERSQLGLGGRDGAFVDGHGEDDGGIGGVGDGCGVGGNGCLCRAVCGRWYGCRRVPPACYGLSLSLL
jgi:hypothetical protein